MLVEYINNKLVTQRLLLEQCNLANMFLKKESNKLLPHYVINYKIVLKQENLLRFSLLYHMLTTKLQAIKEYLLNHLSKGFITPSQALYTLPVLFVRKPNSSLCFCINFQKLNIITYKDQYLLPLINKTLAQISCIKIFTKLNIQQVFYQI